ncbi:MAG: hypothetical protein ACREV5_17155 [Steroidobacter sp.]
MRRLFAVCLTVLLLLSSAGCAGYRHQQWRTADQSAYDTSAYALRFIEADDEGWFWDRTQADEAMQLIRREAAERDTIVLVFVHGWHHSAECCDGNVEGFRNTLSKLHSLRPNFNLVGVYVGWRGQSLPMPLNYLTFWGRKGAAERVGENDLKEFMSRLQDLYLEFRPDARGPEQTISTQSSIDAVEAPRNFLGLVTLGHSFGAQVLLKAVTGSLEDQLQGRNKNPAYLRSAQSATPNPDETSTISGVGDLIVLINPAAEASQYHRLHILSHGLNYSRLQTPLILTVSAENDRSRHRLFTLGRILGEFFTGKPRKDDDVERIVERQALGVYRGHVTHQLAPTDDDVDLVSTTLRGDARQCSNKQSCEVAWRAWRAQPVATRPNSLTPGDARLREFDFSRDVVFNNVELSALTDDAIRELGDDPQAYGAAQPYQPFIVARASKKIIDDHSGIFTDPFLQFLIPYIAYIEEKSKLNVEPKREKREAEMKAGE